MECRGDCERNVEHPHLHARIDVDSLEEIVCILNSVLSTIPLYDEGEVFRSPHMCFGEHLTAVRTKKHLGVRGVYGMYAASTQARLLVEQVTLENEIA